MSSAFPFVPRTVSNAKRKPARQGPQAAATAESASLSKPTTSSSQPVVTRAGNPSTTTTGSRVKYSNEDYTNLLCLALSDHALWADPDLRRRMEWSSESGSSDGFFPLSHLLKHSKLLAPLYLESLQTPIAKALRSGEGADVLDVRLLVSDPSPSTWSSGRGDTRDLGAYEIRRKDWREALSRPSRDYSRAEWDKRTIYVENIPVQYRSTAAIARFVFALLAEHPSSNATLTRVQSISFLPHHQDKPGDQPTCKGFALIVLKDDLDVDFLLKRWPWDRQHGANSLSDCQEEQEAIKFGFRALPKLRWDQLKAEYLAYRGELVAEINAHEDADPQIPIIPSTSKLALQQDALEPPIKPASRSMAKETDLVMLDSSSPYPFNSLVFVRNIHPETNKTTLRKFFATAFRSSLASGDLEGDGLDYVDFNKGMDSCHLRLTTPKHARILVDHFVTHPTWHVTGLDEVGAPADDKSPPAVSMDLVTGRREELYWEKVPEKVRRQAVQKALALLHGPSEVDSGGGSNIDGQGDRDRDPKRRKRRKQ